MQKIKNGSLYDVHCTRDTNDLDHSLLGYNIYSFEFNETIRFYRNNKDICRSWVWEKGEPLFQWFYVFVLGMILLRNIHKQ